ncbi:extracellular solute-binding protein [Alicyclobacillus fastidiosus]|uniref:Extracellular solute-binding protein n=1 Tax=Alicyclobacillus fastidiosus TaxID=392011 RepID=A0ABY6ZAC2_9BACL|nr:extracellular solute-binding protein [Alicyclobacillus fastidiosus]WAH39833.1 extracellular solute-binding protein [Alicyclobacillus fastidiosus]GMA61090.1 sugar ABC transporter permease [Alicyclobacillus fastidiosus]
MRKKRFSKKVMWSTGVVAALTTTVTGCGTSGNSGGSQTGSSSVTQVSMFAAPGPDIINLNTNAFTKYVEKKFGINITWDTVPSSDQLTKQSLLLASGNYPDIFWNGNFTNSQAYQYGKEGAFIPLNSLIKQYAPNLEKAMQTVPGLKQDMVAPDGNIYTIPNYNYCFHCFWSAKYWINTKLLKQYGLKMPTNTAQFTQVLEAFKQHGLIPLTGATVTTSWHSNPVTFLMNAFIYDDGGSAEGGSWFEIKNGKPVFVPIQPQYEQGLEYIHSLYSKGLIDPSAFTQTNTSLETEVSQGKVGVVPNGSSTGFIDNYGAKGSNYQYWLTVPPLTGPSGARNAAFYPSPAGGTFAITNKASQEEAIKIMKLINFIWNPNGTGTQMLDFGPEGTDWTTAKPGQLGLNGKQGLFNTNWNAFYSGNARQNEGWNQMGPIDQSETWRNGGVAIPPFSSGGSQSMLQLVTQQNYAGLQPEYVFPSAVWIQPSDIQTYTTDQTNINNYVNQWTDAFVTGSKSISSDWNAYVQGLENLDLTNYISMSEKGMGQPFNTSSFQQDPSDVKFLLNDK